MEDVYEISYVHAHAIVVVTHAGAREEKSVGKNAGKTDVILVVGSTTKCVVVNGVAVG